MEINVQCWVLHFSATTRAKDVTEKRGPCSQHCESHQGRFILGVRSRVVSFVRSLPKRARRCNKSLSLEGSRNYSGSAQSSALRFRKDSPRAFLCFTNQWHRVAPRRSRMRAKDVKPSRTRDLKEIPTLPTCDNKWRQVYAFSTRANCR